VPAFIGISANSRQSVREGPCIFEPRRDDKLTIVVDEAPFVVQLNRGQAFAESFGAFKLRQNDKLSLFVYEANPAAESDVGNSFRKDAGKIFKLGRPLREGEQWCDLRGRITSRYTLRSGLLREIGTRGEPGVFWMRGLLL
jgi:hypothetical protein